MTSGDHGYRAGAALAPGDTARVVRVIRGGALLIAAAIVVALIAPPGGPSRTPPDQGRQPPSAGPPATPLPALLVDGPAPTAPFPVLAGGLRWLDPVTGTMSGSSFDAPRGAVFTDPDGSTCVCRESPWTDSGDLDRIVLLRFGPDGRPVDRHEVIELASPMSPATGTPIQFDVARSPDRRTIAIAWILRADTAWRVGFVTADARTGEIRGQVTLADLPLGPGADGSSVTGGGRPRPDLDVMPPVVRIAPDGLEARVAVATRPAVRNAPMPPWNPLAWTIPLDQSGGLAGSPAPAIVAQDPGIECDGETYVSRSVYASLCGTLDGPPERYVRTDAPAGGSDRLYRLPDDFVEPGTLAELVDTTNGRLFIWSATAAAVARVGSTGTGLEILSLAADGDPANAQPSNHWPGPSTGVVRWGQLGSALEVAPTPALAGSADGSLLYAVGVHSGAPLGLPDEPSGIWVIDARTLGLVARWDAPALYSAIAFSPDMRWLVGVGRPVEGTAARASGARVLAIVDPATGRLAELVGDAVDPSGYGPSLVVPGG
jgi:hypothetical protein